MSKIKLIKCISVIAPLVLISTCTASLQTIPYNDLPYPAALELDRINETYRLIPLIGDQLWPHAGAVSDFSVFSNFPDGSVIASTTNKRTPAGFKRITEVSSSNGKTFWYRPGKGLSSTCNYFFKRGITDGRKKEIQITLQPVPKITNADTVNATTSLPPEFTSAEGDQPSRLHEWFHIVQAGLAPSFLKDYSKDRYIVSPKLAAIRAVEMESLYDAITGESIPGQSNATDFATDKKQNCENFIAAYQREMALLSPRERMSTLCLSKFEGSACYIQKAALDLLKPKLANGSYLARYPFFHDYGNSEMQRSFERRVMRSYKRNADVDLMRFYQIGAGICMLLDSIVVDWKEQINLEKDDPADLMVRFLKPNSEELAAANNRITPRIAQWEIFYSAPQRLMIKKKAESGPNH